MYLDYMNQLSRLLILCRLRAKVFLYHKRDLKGYSVFKLTKIKSRELTDLLKSVNKSVSVNKEFSRCFGNVEVIFKETLDGKECFVVKAFD